MNEENKQQNYALVPYTRRFFFFIDKVDKQNWQLLNYEIVAFSDKMQINNNRITS